MKHISFGSFHFYINLNDSLFYIGKSRSWYIDSKELKLKVIKKLPMFIQEYRQQKVEKKAIEVFGSITFQNWKDNDK